MPRPKARRTATAKGADEVGQRHVAGGETAGNTAKKAAGNTAKKVTKKELDERDRYQSAQRKAPGPARKASKQAKQAKRTADVAPTDPI